MFSRCDVARSSCTSEAVSAVTEDHLIVPIPPERQHLRSWRVVVDGAVVDPVMHVVIAHPTYGTLAYGLTPGGYDGWSFRESSGGGVVILPHIELRGVLHVVVVEQHRPNQGGVVLNAPRGFIDRGESPAAAAARELEEELGVAFDPQRLRALPGAPANPNSAFFETPASDEGVVFFTLTLEPGELVAGEDGLGLEPVSRAGRAAGGCASEEGIIGAKLLPWHRAAGLSDMITNAAVARLLSARAAFEDSSRPVGIER